MANLKGSDFEKQLRDARIRLDARGIKRFGEFRHDGRGHSHLILKTRKQHLARFADFLRSIEFSGKINQGMTKENFEIFFEKNISSMSARSREMFFSSYSALVKGLREKNITIDERVDYHFFQRCKDRYAARPDDRKYASGRYIDQKAFAEILHNLADRSVFPACLQYYYGFRAEEALEVASNPSKYIIGQNIVNVKGKGGQLYPQKPLQESDWVFYQKPIEKLSRDAYFEDMKKVLKGHRPHDLRLSYVMNEYQKLRREGVAETEALKQVSVQINHHRASTTRYYLARA